MKLTSEEYEEYSESNQGYCPKCDDVTDGFFEPDATNYQCEHCNKNIAMGIENAMICGYIEITD